MEALLVGITFIASTAAAISKDYLRLVDYFPRLKNVPAKGNVSLSCTFEGNPRPSVYWHVEGSNFSSSILSFVSTSRRLNDSVEISFFFLKQPFDFTRNFAVTCSANNSQQYIDGRLFVLTIDPTDSTALDIFTRNWHVVVAGCLGILVFVLLVAYLCYKKYGGENMSFSVTYPVRTHNHTRRTSSDDCAALENGTYSDVSPDDLPKDTDIHEWNLEDYFINGHKQNDKEFAYEFERLPYVAHCSEFPRTSANLPSNDAKNRYSNILPYDYTRVKLSVQGTDTSSDYINASFVDGYHQDRKFICTQAPLATTISDFWRMVWEQRSRIIVMLVKLTESGQVKSEEYWPPAHQSYIYNVIMVKFVDELLRENYIKRTFLVSKIREDKEYTAWPPHEKLSLTTSPLLEFHAEVMKSYSSIIKKNKEFPITVHCSGGIGRTGVFVAFDHLLDELKEKRRVNIFMTVVNMRRQRYGIVQNLTFYVYLFKLLLESHLFGETAVEGDRLTEYIASLKRVTSESQCTGFDKQFSEVDRVEPPDLSQTLGNKHMELNRHRQYLPYDSCLARIQSDNYGSTGPYYNASYIGKLGANVLIAAQGPLSDSEDLFWRLNIDNDVKIIVMMTGLFENGKSKSAQYWPGNNVRDYGNVKVQLIQETNHGDYDERMLTASYKNKTASVLQMQFTSWLDGSAPKSVENLLCFVDQLLDRVAEQRDDAVLVHCSDGCRRTGCFCVILQAARRLRCGDKVDVFRSIKDMKDARPYIVPTLEEYKMVYDIVGAYARRLKKRLNGRIQVHNSP